MVAFAETVKAKDEIEFLTIHGWSEWWSELSGSMWDKRIQYRARPAQPKMKKLRMLCYTYLIYLIWRSEVWLVPGNWIRVPSEDKEIEVPE